MLAAVCSTLLALAERTGPTTLGWESHGPPALDVEALVVSPLQDDVAYAVSRDRAGEGALFRTVDAGNHWDVAVLVPVGESLKRLAIDPIDPQRLVAQTYDGTSVRLYETEDAGADWALAATYPGADANALFYDYNGFAYLVAQGVAFTNQAGPWTQLSPRTLISGWPDRIGNSYFTNKMHYCWGFGFGCLDELDIVRRSKGEFTWSTPAPCESMVATYAASDPLVAYAWNCGALRSHDGGTTWDPLPIPDAQIAVDPEDALTAYALTAAEILSTCDGFVSWRGISLPAPDTRSIAMTATGRYLFAATASGVYRRIASGRETRAVERAGPP